MIATHWANGGEGAEDLAQAVVHLLDSKENESSFKTLYPDVYL
mgnify:FL=1